MTRPRHYGLSHLDSVRSGDFPQAVPPDCAVSDHQLGEAETEKRERLAAEKRAAARRSKARSILFWVTLPWLGAAVLILIALFGGGVLE